MRGALYMAGRVLQIVGMGTVLIAFLSFFTTPDMGAMMKTTLFGAAEFYIGNFIVGKTGERIEGPETRGARGEEKK